MGVQRKNSPPTASAVPAPAAFLEFEIASDPTAIADTRKSVEQFATQVAGLDVSAANDVGLCVNEALANIMRHAYDGRPDRKIRLTLDIVGDAAAPALRVAMRDWGNGVDPSTIPPPPYDPLSPGGVGLICLKTLLDEVVYSPQPDGMLTTMVRRRVRPAM